MTAALSEMWRRFGFRPNPEQQAAILHGDGPLFLPAGPGAGKTRVLLWRVVKLLVLDDTPPEQIFLATFTEKAALQLREGLQRLLAAVAPQRPVELPKMYVGTIHSLCRRLLTDPRFSPDTASQPRLLDELGQYLYLRRKRIWKELTAAAGRDDWSNEWLNGLFGSKSNSRHVAIANAVSFFNRLSEDCLEVAKPASVPRRRDEPAGVAELLAMYAAYRRLLDRDGLTDFALLQQAALRRLEAGTNPEREFRHVIVDEYQDTNTVQEQLFFRLARAHRNLCVVGDDDQSLYRFRGATVENFLQFPERCERLLGVTPRRVPLGENFRSRPAIVEFSRRFLASCDWGGDLFSKSRRIDKRLRAARTEPHPAVVTTAPGEPVAVAAEIARFLRGLLDQHRVTNANQIAVLFPSLKSTLVPPMRQALQGVGLDVYAPRAGRFLEVPEAVTVFGSLFRILGPPERGAIRNRDHTAFHDWVDDVVHRADELLAADEALAAYVQQRQAEASQVAAEFPRRNAATLPWTVLDLFYELCGFRCLRELLERSDDGDEGPLCNLGLVSRYLARFVEEFGWLLTAERLATNWYRRVFGGFLYALFRRGESEYEDADDPFPKGRVPFLTIHQAKGLEFPVVVLAAPRKAEQDQPLETLMGQVERHLGRPDDEDGEGVRTGKLDAQRMFYVALTRAKELLVLPHLRGVGQRMNEPLGGLIQTLPRIGAETENLTASPHSDGLRRTYSFTGDFLPYRECPRRYFLFHHHAFAPARQQPQFFGRLVHATIDEWHRQLISRRDSREAVPADDALRRIFDATFERLRGETGCFLRGDVRETAWLHVLLYWRRLPQVASAVSESELRLSLPDQITPRQRRYTLEAVLDVVSDADGATLYDLKTGLPDEIQTHLSNYRRQIGVYAHAWRQMRPELPLVSAAIIGTSPPDSVLRAAKQDATSAEFDAALAAWNPLVPVAIDETDVASTLTEFGTVVDAIEAGEFSPPSPAALTREHESTVLQRVCRGCDARHSCPSYRAVMAGAAKFDVPPPPRSSTGWNPQLLGDDGRTGDELA